MNYINEKIIETDEDTREADENENGSIYPYDLTDIVIDMSEDSHSVYEYLRKFDQGRINTQPDFQRNLVWTKGKQSRFVESIILNFPLPAIYLNETMDGKYFVIDGLQRTTALHDFFHNKFDLSELEALPRINKKKFRDLPTAMQRKFEDKKLNIYNLRPSTPLPVIYDLFNRINTGGTQLNKQEVRNCIFIGKSTRLLKELSEDTCFSDAIDGGISPTRMKDRETILRYIAFRWFDYKSFYYSSNMSDYLEMAMKNINTSSDSEIDTIRKDFRRVMKWSYDIWNKQNFRIPIDGKRGTINSSIFETICNYLSHNTDDYLKDNLENLRNNYFYLIEDKTYYDAVTRATGNKSKVIERFRIANEILNRTIVDKDSNSELYSVSEEFDDESTIGDEQLFFDNSNSPSIETKHTRNQDSFVFNNGAYKKGPLAWAIIHQYVSDKKGKITYNELKRVFPNELMIGYKSYGFFEKLFKAKGKYGENNKRYYFSADKVIVLLDAEIVVCTQFTTENIREIIKIANSLGYKIKKLENQ